MYCVIDHSFFYSIRHYGAQSNIFWLRMGEEFAILRGIKGVVE
ncbi:hypothetical protein CLOSTMETH_01554 [[Clostridium] methylpentosum DSM 5476]|uniref:Uncharacterized protein n=1 Tax=[Clostridium] methylpentosum DSM 5476 TaxID=537013 RepID=C0ECI3_9FIRM|nr:hypothetical protein CLOSTMETH_01554 [[Clostridium] methylpentosum DSM 5476]